MDYKKLFSDFKTKNPDIPLIMGATTIISHKNYYIFSINQKKYWKQEGNKLRVGFSGIGGRVEEGETPFDAAHREVKEEIGEDITLKKKDETIYIDEDGNKKKIRSDDGPVFIVEFTSPGIPGDMNQPGRWGMLLFIYFGQISNDPLPTKEIPGIILLDKSSFETIIYKDMIPIDLLKKYAIIRLHEDIPENTIFFPKFSTQVISSHKINPNEYIGL